MYQAPCDNARTRYSVYTLFVISVGQMAGVSDWYLSAHVL
jgi:hypothetical protein